MKIIHLISILTVALILNSCSSSMKVTVDALNMPAFRATYLYNAERINKTENQLKYILSPKFKTELDDSVNILVGYIDTSGLVPTNDIQEFTSYIHTNYENTLANLFTNAQKLLSSGSAVREGNVLR